MYCYLHVDGRSLLSSVLLEHCHFTDAMVAAEGTSNRVSPAETFENPLYVIATVPDVGTLVMFTDST